jgi:ammonia channel protein AmtB
VSGSGLSDELRPAIGLTALLRFIGNLDYFCLKGVLAQPSIGSTRIPALLFCIYQCMFCVSPNPPQSQ